MQSNSYDTEGSQRNHYDGGKLGRIKEDKDVKKGLSERYDIFKVS